MLIDEIVIGVITSRNATVAEVEYTDLQATGSAKREPGEIFQEEVGIDLAVARSLRSLATKLEKRAWSRIPKVQEPSFEELVEELASLLAIRHDTTLKERKSVDA